MLALDNQEGSVEKRRQQRPRLFSVLTYHQYAPRAKLAVTLLDGLNRPEGSDIRDIPEHCGLDIIIIQHFREA